MEEIKPSRLWINLLGIAGASIGLSTLFLPWLTTMGNVPGSQPTDEGLFGPMSIYILMHDRLAFCSCVLYLIGLAMAFISPIGSIVQTVGISLFIFDQSVTGISGVTPISTTPLFGLISGIIGLIAFIKPFGIGFENKAYHKWPLLLNFGINRK